MKEFNEIIGMDLKYWFDDPDIGLHTTDLFCEISYIRIYTIVA